MLTYTAWRVPLSLALVLGAAFGFAESGGYYPPADKDGGWRTLPDAAKIRSVAGINLSRLDQAFEFEKETSQHGGLVVVRHGYLVYEKYFGKGNREAHPDMASIGKAFTSVSCGIMLKEKQDQIPDGLETKVFTDKYLPQAFPLDDPAKADIKLGQLLSMSAGLHGEGGNPGIVNGSTRSSIRFPALPDLWIRIWSRCELRCGPSPAAAIPTPRVPHTLRRSYSAT